jgi:hypothetical protein
MSARTNLKQLASDIDTVMRDLARAEQRVEHLERILRQAVLTHDNKLVIDPKHAEEALKSTAQLWIGGGSVTLIPEVN